MDSNHYAVRIDKGEEVLEQLTLVCQKEKITCGQITGLGASNKVEIGLFNTSTKEYKTTVKEGMFEVTSLVGNITNKEGTVYIHCHINFSDSSLKTYGGHLVKCYISATGEIIITKIEGMINRNFHSEIGLNLFSFPDQK